MTEKDLKHLSRANLLEMLIEQSTELQKTKKKLKALEKEMSERNFAIENAGSVAGAALLVNGVFKAAQGACDQYMENIQLICDKKAEEAKIREEESIKRAEDIIKEAEKRANEMKIAVIEKCEEMIEKKNFFRSSRIWKELKEAFEEDE